MLKEAEIIEQQMLSRGGGVGVAQVTSQPDYSAQWAEYYRWSDEVMMKVFF